MESPPTTAWRVVGPTGGPPLRGEHKQHKVLLHGRVEEAAQVHTARLARPSPAQEPVPYATLLHTAEETPRSMAPASRPEAAGVGGGLGREADPMGSSGAGWPCRAVPVRDKALAFVSWRQPATGHGHPNPRRGSPPPRAHGELATSMIPRGRGRCGLPRDGIWVASRQKTAEGAVRLVPTLGPGTAG